MSETCGNCKWLKVSEKSLTKHSPPRYKPGAMGICEWPEETALLSLPLSRSIIRRPMEVCDTNCPTWEAKDEGR